MPLFDGASAAGVAYTRDWADKIDAHRYQLWQA